MTLPTRCWFQFRLRTLLIAVMLVGVAGCRDSRDLDVQVKITDRIDGRPVAGAIVFISAERSDADVAVQAQVGKDGSAEIEDPFSWLKFYGTENGHYRQLDKYSVKVVAVGFQQYLETLDKVVGQREWPIGKALPLLSIELSEGGPNPK